MSIVPGKDKEGVKGQAACPQETRHTSQKTNCKEESREGNRVIYIDLCVSKNNKQI